MKRLKRNLWWLWGDPLAAVGFLILVALVIAAIIAPWIAPFDPVEQHLSETLQAPGPRYILGTDQFGRDILSRIIYGARISLTVGVGAVLIAVTIGTITGILAGYIGGRLDDLIMRITDIFFAFPPIVLAIFLMAVVGPSIMNVIVVVGLVSIPQFTRMCRSVALNEKYEDYILAERAMGASTFFLIRRHFLPNVLPPLAVQATVLLADAILIEAALSFLGIGVRPPTPTWGSILSDGRHYVIQGLWWFTVFPGIAIFLSVFSLNVLGDGLRDYIDPTTRQRRG